MFNFILIPAFTSYRRSLAPVPRGTIHIRNLLKTSAEATKDF